MNGSRADLSGIGTLPIEAARVASRSLLDEVLTVKRIDGGFLVELVGGPRETVAVDIFSEAVRPRDLVEEGVSVYAPDGLTTADRRLRRDDMSDDEIGTKLLMMVRPAGSL